MKKVFVLLVVALCLFFLFLGCTRNESDAVVTRNPDKYISFGSFLIATEENIKAYAEGNLEIPGDFQAADGSFVNYDAIKIIGSVDWQADDDTRGGLLLWPPAYYHYYFNDNTYAYTYFLEDTNGYVFKMEIVHPGVYQDEIKAYISDSIKDATPNQRTPTEVIESGGVYKNYTIGGELCEIFFFIDDLVFRINPYISDPSETSFVNYPKEGEKTILYRFINGTESEIRSAVREFEDWFFAHSPSRNIRRLLPPIGIGTAVAALGATGFVVWRKKKRKAANKPESPEPQPVDTPQQA